MMSPDRHKAQSARHKVRDGWHNKTPAQMLSGAYAARDAQVLSAYAARGARGAQAVHSAQVARDTPST